MPLYELQCESCGHTFEALVFRRSEIAEERCPRCGAENPQQLLSAVASVGASKSSGGSSSCGGGSGRFT
jgi:putative FmdB family regulatory protein